jgi:cell division inhibitor SepF
MGFMNSFKKKFGSAQQEPQENYDFGAQNGDYYPQQDPYAQLDYGASQAAQMQAQNAAAASMELKMVYPTQFAEVAAIAKDLMGKRTIVMNLEKTAPDVTRRLLDFLSGVAFCIGGQMQPIANQTYIITPGNIDVSREQFKAQQQAQMQAQAAQMQAQQQAQMQAQMQNNMYNQMPNYNQTQNPYGGNDDFGGFNPFGQM